MRFQRRKVAVALAYVLGAGGGVAVVSGPVLAQPAPTPPTTAQYQEKIRVTGTNIPVISGETALPVQIITRDEIERQGIQTAAALVERLAANSTTGGITLSSTEGNTGAGQSSASLRGLGAQRTLVLLNGRRLAVSGFNGGSVDINSIPLSAIERVEVLTDGASAIYGSDAIAGVINFILRQDYQGAEASVFSGDSRQGGGYQQIYNATLGFGDLQTQKFNVFGTVNYQQSGGLKASQRSFSSSAFRPDLGIDKTSGNTVPANVQTPVGTRNPANPGCAPPFSFPTSVSPLQCRFDYASVIDILPPQQMLTAVARATWQFNPENQAFAEFVYGDNKVQSAVSPMPVSQATIFPFSEAAAVLIPSSSPFYPHDFAKQFGIDGQPLNVTWRSLVLGPRRENDEAKQARAVVGLKGALWGWDYDTSIQWNQNKSYAWYPAGWALGSKLLPILNSGKINVFAVTIPQDQIDLLAPAVINEQIISSKATTNGFSLTASRDIFNLPAGPLALALGGDYYKSTYEFLPSADMQAGDIVGTGSSLAVLPQVSRRNYDFFAEFSIPIVKTLEANAAVRYDHYDDFGSTTNPKISLRWQPAQSLLVRGSWGTGFRAPTLPELFTPSGFSSTGGNYSDPVRCPVTKSSLDCNTQFNDLLGGNPALKPEKSTQYGAGVVWETVPGFTVGTEYWNIKVKSVVGTLGEQNIFGQDGELIPQSEAAGLIVRFPASPTDIAQGLPGRVNYAILTNLNIQTLEVDGWDFTVNYRFPKVDWGQFYFALNGTYYAHWKQTDLTTGALTNYAGQSVGGIATVTAGPGFPASLPRYKQNMYLNYNYGPWAATLSNVYQSGYSDDNPCNVPTAVSGTCPRNVGSYSLWDLSGSYTGFKYWTLSLGIKNFMNTNPPASNQSEAFQLGYDPTYADPRGRFIWGMIKFTYK